MNRLLSILIAIFVLFLLYIWINHLISSGDPTARETADYIQNNAMYGDQGSADEYPLSNYSGKKHIPEAKAAEENGQVEETFNEEDEPVKTTPEAEAEPKSNPPVAASSQHSGEGEHLVIAGNFTGRANAQKRVDELKSYGFAGAEVVNFELSEYHTVCAGRFSDINEARKVSKKIKDFHNIDSYVRNGNKP